MKSFCCTEKNKVPIQFVLKFLKLISDENRLKIICLLGRGEKCVCDIWQELKIPQNLASHHLKTLKDFGLLSSKKEGVKVIYRLKGKVLQKYQDMLNYFLTSH